MSTPPPPVRTITVEEYRELLASRLREDDIVGADAAGHAELVFNLTQLHHRLSRDSRACIVGGAGCGPAFAS